MNNLSPISNESHISLTPREYDEIKDKDDKFNYWNKYAITWFVGLSLLLITPLIIGYILDWFLDFNIDNLIIYITLFGFNTLFHFICQIIFSYFDKSTDRKIKKINLEEFPSVNIQITGWREDPLLFRKCLISLKNQNYSNVKQITFCSDGNDEDDLYLINIFEEIFQNEAHIVNLSDIGKDLTKQQQNKLFSSLKNKKYICFLQPHGGKRHAMYTQLINNIYQKCDYMLLTDSDTIFEEDALLELMKGINYYKCNAITGDVQIYNPDNYIGYLVSLRYWFAFNIERSAQSYFGSVSCISGPFGLYKTDMISKISNLWINQTFCHKECTFGDDRHLTNLVFKEQGTVYYTNNATCYTDTPTQLLRLISQQTRWGKSFFREYLLNLSWFRIKNIWLVYDITFMLFYPIFLLIISVVLFLKCELQIFLVLLTIILVVSYIRAIYAIIETKDINYLLFALYGIFYFLFILPLKPWAMITVNITNWGTGNRMEKSFKNIDILPVGIWITFCFATFITSFIKILVKDNYSYNDNILIITSIIIISNVIILCILYLLLNKKYKKKVEQKIENIVNEFLIT